MQIGPSEIKMQTLKIKTTKREEIIDISNEVGNLIKDIKNGSVLVYARHATAAIIINENYDPNISIDLLNLLNELIPGGKWLHDRIDNNAAAHLKASLLGPSESIPVRDGKLMLGKWQNIFLCEFDGPREREIIIQKNAM